MSQLSPIQHQFEPYIANPNRCKICKEYRNCCSGVSFNENKFAMPVLSANIKANMRENGHKFVKNTKSNNNLCKFCNKDEKYHNKFGQQL
jgi:hypothetical protein